MKELRTLINFTQLRFHCKKQKPGRTFHINTFKNSSGEAVVQYFSGQTDVLPYACGSFYKMNDDNSELANKVNLAIFKKIHKQKSKQMKNANTQKA